MVIAISYQGTAEVQSAINGPSYSPCSFNAGISQPPAYDRGEPGSNDPALIRRADK
jgi:hypothetical protein